MTWKNWARTFLLLFLTTQVGWAEYYVFDGKHSTIGFEIGHFTGVAKGKFKSFSGILKLDEQNMSNSAVELKIQVDSIDTGSPKRDQHLQEDDYFDSAKFPKITFQSKSFKRRGDRFIVTGPLTIHGVTKNITLYLELADRHEQWAVNGEVLTFQSEYELNRLDFGVNGGQPAVGKTVKIKLDIHALED